MLLFISNREKKYPVLLSYNINAYQDEFVDRQVMNLEVTCGKKEYGCLWFNRLKYEVKIGFETDPNN